MQGGEVGMELPLPTNEQHGEGVRVGKVGTTADEKGEQGKPYERIN